MRISDWSSDVCSSDLVIALWRNHRNHEVLIRWAMLGTLAVFAFAFCFFQTRAGPAAQALGIPGAAMLGWILITLAERLRTPLRAIAIAGVFLLVSGLGFQLATKALPGSKPGTTSRKATLANRQCATLAALEPLNRIPPATLFTFLDLSPRLIVGTHHSAIVGPYHRNEIGRESCRERVCQYV